MHISIHHFYSFVAFAAFFITQIVCLLIHGAFLQECLKLSRLKCYAQAIHRWISQLNQPNRRFDRAYLKADVLAHSKWQD